jgi:hypothetical protein
MYSNQSSTSIIPTSFTKHNHNLQTWWLRACKRLSVWTILILQLKFKLQLSCVIGCGQKIMWALLMQTAVAQLVAINSNCSWLFDNAASHRINIAIQTRYRCRVSYIFIKHVGVRLPTSNLLSWVCQSQPPSSKSSSWDCRPRIELVWGLMLGCCRSAGSHTDRSTPDMYDFSVMQNL